ncbi:hypothetical protein NO1_0764 [Candidatus Termititenax aidoneus]|uniref:Uncharacterized protein n=1 Tax=Termititenax aidoneus TaxID=2218524 RepID=A0A388TAQ5_TERA1|nr:hypothetical protein NO1_0764 [Candidatus Termititenax aidoneus]
MVDFLTDYYTKDRSALIKHLLQEMYENIADTEVIYSFLPRRLLLKQRLDVGVIKAEEE